MSDRPPFFAIKFCRTLAQTSAHELGPEVCWLLMVVAQQEDVNRYDGPVTFWNSQLMRETGLRSVGRLDRARKAAVRAGWLSYVAGDKKHPGQYRVLVPDSAQIQSQNGQANGQTGQICSRKTDTKTGGKRYANGRKTVGKYAPFNPNPNPNPTPAAAGAAASPTPAAIADAIFSVWNALDGVRHCQTLSKSRRDKIATRLRDAWWRDNWREALARIPSAKFLHANERGWKADFDWFLKPDSAAALLEGKYDTVVHRTNGNQRFDSGPSFRHPADIAEEEEHGFRAGPRPLTEEEQRYRAEHPEEQQP